MVTKTSKHSRSSNPRKGLDVRRMVHHFGGPAALYEQLRKEGYKLSLRAIHQWVRRGQISIKWIMALTHLAEKQRKKFTLNDFVDQEAPPEVQRKAVDMSFLD